MTFLQQCVAFIDQLSYKQLPKAAVASAKQAIIDTVAAMLAGVNDPATQKVLAYVAKERPIGGAAVLGTSYCFSPASAALVNGTMAHALDYDDVLTSARCHPSAVLVPTVLAVGQTYGQSGADILTAYVTGLEVIAKVGRLSSFPQYEKGWHTTSTVGALGSAAAASKLMKLTEQEIRMALGIAASTAGGLRKNFGTMTKPLHCGLAARAGIMAATLASEGFTAAEDVFSGKYNYLEVFANQATLERQISFDPPLAIISPGLDVKRYPCCAAAHRALDAICKITADTPSFRANDIVSVTCLGPGGFFSPLVFDDPRTALEGKFSMQYIVAAQLLDGCVNLRSFTDAMVQRPEIRSFMPRVVKGEDPTLKIADLDGTDRRFTEVTVTMADGQVVKNRVDRPKGSRSDPLTDDEIDKKFLECGVDILSHEKQHAALHRLRELEHVENISELLRHLCVEGVGATAQ